MSNKKYSGLVQAKERIYWLEEKSLVIDQKEKKEGENHDLSYADFWDTITRNHIQVLGVPQCKEGERRRRPFTEVTTENLHNTERKRDVQVQEAHRTPNGHDQVRSSPRHVVVKLSTVKQRF